MSGKLAHVHELETLSHDNLVEDDNVLWHMGARQSCLHHSSLSCVTPRVLMHNSLL